MGLKTKKPSGIFCESFPILPIHNSNFFLLTPTKLILTSLTVEGLHAGSKSFYQNAWLGEGNHKPSMVINNLFRREKEKWVLIRSRAEGRNWYDEVSNCT